jgi:V8-like Glu-specific endopeptidase
MISWKAWIAGFAAVALALILFFPHPAKARATVPAAAAYRGISAVGALVALNRNGTVNHLQCTASVLSSPAGNLILTAAGCLDQKPPAALAFIPGYRGGQGHPFGLWLVTGQDLPADLLPAGPAGSDFAFLTVHGDVEAITGAETLGTIPPVPRSAQVIGYASAGDPVTCTRPLTMITVSGQPQLKFTCRGYAAGSTGAPFLTGVSPITGNGTVLGILDDRQFPSDRQKGPGLPPVSYASPFGAAVTALYTTVTSDPAAAPYRGISAVGALVILNHNGTVNHIRCTGSVLSSPAGNLILTAAHCLGRHPPLSMAFVPGYHYGSRFYPLGEWRVTGQALPAGWLPDRDANRDFAFLTVRGDVQAFTGAETLGLSSPAPRLVRVIGYTAPGFPLTCTQPPTTVIVSGQPQLKFACSGYAGASSGAPFLVNVSATTGNGTVVGVLGGYQKGGSTPLISYSSPFGAVIKAFYDTAILGPAR